jgi:hypothetical protein
VIELARATARAASISASVAKSAWVRGPADGEARRRERVRSVVDMILE